MILLLEETANCNLCNKMLKENELKLRDGDHVTGEYCGIAWSSNLSLPKYIPINIQNIRYNSICYFNIFCIKLNEKHVDTKTVLNTIENYTSLWKKIIIDQFKRKFDYL